MSPLLLLPILLLLPLLLVLFPTTNLLILYPPPFSSSVAIGGGGVEARCARDPLRRGCGACEAVRATHDHEPSIAHRPQQGVQGWLVGLF